MVSWQGDRWPGKFPGVPVPFSWSCLRHAIFSSCPRAYYHRYYAADGGWDKFADNSAQKAYALKYASSADEWLREILATALRQTLMLQRSEREKSLSGFAQQFRQAAFHLFGQGAVSTRNHEWKKDPKKLNLLEVQKGEIPLEKLLENLRDRLVGLTEGLILCEFFEHCCKVPYLAFKPLKPPNSFEHEGIEVWVAPDLVWTEGDTLRILQIQLAPHQDDEAWRLGSNVCILWAAETFKLLPEHIFCGTLEAASDGKLWEEAYPGHMELEKTRRIISTSAATMLACLPQKNEAPSEKNFPKHSNAPDEICKACRYVDICWQ
ncbi:MAG: hypothetical protein A2X49_16950 [Lentisphaerae bacterium GWF2_52_8]|nr:MAG: hypothetical protein A2X49_16950 [Lentisphaerae bacterium GWF2_52_8]